MDWVRARNACSSQQMFERLKADITEDVKTRNELINRHPEFGAPFGFRVLETPNGIRILRESNPPISATVVITLENGLIKVDQYNGVTTFIATVTLNNEGECVFMVKGQELQSWQFRKMVLERLFFYIP